MAQKERNALIQEFEAQQWKGFKGKTWKNEIDVRDFIQNNYTLYEGDDSFLAGPTEATTNLWAQVMDLNKQEV